jgi:anti-anti-sigma factor
MSSPARDFSLAFSRALGRVVVELGGALDAGGAAELQQRLVDVIDGQGNRRLVIDLTGTTRVDQAGLAVLVDALKRLRRTGGELVLSGPTDRVVRSLEAAGLDRIFAITPSWAHPAYGDGSAHLGPPVRWGRSG